MEMNRQGYQGMRVDDVLRRTGLKKGALYHHFSGKQELGYAVLDEVIGDYVRRWWVKPMQTGDDPVDALRAAMGAVGAEFGEELVVTGCPLSNIAQEMSPLDEGFRSRAEALFGEWKQGIADALERGKESGKIRRDVDCTPAAEFILASLEGCVGLAKNSRNVDTLKQCSGQLVRYLEALRP